MPRNLPNNPSVEFLQKEAKKLIKSHKKGDATCCRTLRYHFRFSRYNDDEIMNKKVTLGEAQHALSLDYGFRNWKELKAHVEAGPSVTFSGLQKAATLLLWIGERFTKAFFDRAEENTLRMIVKCMPEVSAMPSDIIKKVTREAIHSLEPDSVAQPNNQKSGRLRQICESNPEKVEQLIKDWIGDAEKERRRIKAEQLLQSWFSEAEASTSAPISHSSESAKTTVEKEAKNNHGPEPVEHLLHVDPFELSVGYGLLRLIDRKQGGGQFLGKVRAIRRQFATDFGIIVPPMHIRDNLLLPPSSYEILIKGVKVAGAELMVDHYLAMDPGNATQKIDGIEALEPSFNLQAIWIPEDRKEEAMLSGYTVVDNITVLATHLTEVLKKHAHKLLGRQETQVLLHNLEESYPVPVQELVPNLLPLGIVRKVLQNLLQEQMPIRDLLTIVEALADFAPTTKDPDLLTEYVRQELSKSIISPHIEDKTDLLIRDWISE